MKDETNEIKSISKNLAKYIDDRQELRAKRREKSKLVKDFNRSKFKVETILENVKFESKGELTEDSIVSADKKYLERVNLLVIEMERIFPEIVY